MSYDVSKESPKLNQYIFCSNTYEYQTGHSTPIITFYLWFCHAENHLIGWHGDGHDGMDLRVGEVWCQRSGWERCPGGWGKEHPLVLVMRKFYGFRDTDTAGTVLANMIWPNSKSFHLALQRRNDESGQSQSEDPTTACYPAGDPPFLIHPDYFFCLEPSGIEASIWKLQDAAGQDLRPLQHLPPGLVEALLWGRPEVSHQWLPPASPARQRPSGLG